MSVFFVPSTETSLIIGLSALLGTFVLQTYSWYIDTKATVFLHLLDRVFSFQNNLADQV